MMRFIGASVFCALALFTAAPAQADPQCDPVMYHSADPDCWGQYEAHKDFTTEFDIRVDRVWQEQIPDVPGFTMLFIDATRQDTGQSMLLKCGWFAEQDKAGEKCFDLNVGATYRVRGASGYGYVYVYQPINGTMTWLETTCEAPDQDICI
jgi:hypothetical protein